MSMLYATRVRDLLEGIPAHRRLAFLSAFVEASWADAERHLANLTVGTRTLHFEDTSSLAVVLDALRPEDYEPFFEALADALAAAGAELSARAQAMAVEFGEKGSARPAGVPAWLPAEHERAIGSPDEQDSPTDWAATPSPLGFTREIRDRFSQDYFDGKLTDPAD
jgi:hypothetical protein